jgi:hypothetical protein
MDRSPHDLTLGNCEPTPLQREGLYRRAEIYRAWVASGRVRRVDAEAMLVADARQLGCDVDTDHYLAVAVQRPSGVSGPNGRRAAADKGDRPSRGRDADDDGPAVAAGMRLWR